MGPVSNTGPFFYIILTNMSYRKTITDRKDDKGKKERYEQFCYQAEREANERISDKVIKGVKALWETACVA